MKSAKSVGRIVGGLLFVQLVLITAGFIFVMPITTPSYLQVAAAISLEIRTGVLLLTACGVITIGIAIAAFAVFRQHSQEMALLLLAVSVISFSMQAVDNMHMLSMLSLSQQYAQGGASGSDAFGLLATAMRSTRRFSHHTELLVIDLWFLVFFGLLFRLSLIPRALAGFGLLMTAIHLTGVALPPFVGYGSVSVLGYSLALGYLTIGTWLVWKGFEERPTEQDRFSASGTGGRCSPSP